MKNLLLILTIALLSSCSPAKFIITSKEYTNNADYCNFGIKPLNKKAFKLKSIDGIYSECGSYKIGDTLNITKKEFTNY
jgi:hypothetical protein